MNSTKLLAMDRKTDKELKAFLLDLVNAQDQLVDGTTQQFFRRYPEFFPATKADFRALLPFIGTRVLTSEGSKPFSQVAYSRAVLREMRDWLRAIWGAGDEYTADWRLFNLQRHLHRVTHMNQSYDKNLQPPPLEVPVNQALRYLRRHLSRLKRCASKDCKTPFFVADRGKQAYCSVECAEVAQREYKRSWWKKSGPAWRNSRRKGRKAAKSRRGVPLRQQD
jgi:hypothetical protein